MAWTKDNSFLRRVRAVAEAPPPPHSHVLWALEPSPWWVKRPGPKSYCWSASGAKIKAAWFQASAAMSVRFRSSGMLRSVIGSSLPTFRDNLSVPYSRVNLWPAACLESSVTTLRNIPEERALMWLYLPFPVAYVRGAAVKRTEGSFSEIKNFLWKIVSKNSDLCVNFGHVFVRCVYSHTRHVCGCSNH